MESSMVEALDKESAVEVAEKAVVEIGRQYHQVSFFQIFFSC